MSFYQQYLTPLNLPTGGFGARSLLILSAAVQQKRTSFPSHVQPGGDARDPGGRGPGFHDGVHSHPLHGHEVHTRRQNVRKHLNAIRRRCFVFL